MRDERDGEAENIYLEWKSYFAKLFINANKFALHNISRCDYGLWSKHPVPRKLWDVDHTLQTFSDITSTLKDTSHFKDYYECQIKTIKNISNSNLEKAYENFDLWEDFGI